MFRGSSALERGDLKSKEKGQLSIHVDGSDETVKVVLRTIISVNQLSIYGGVADMCEELASGISKCSEGTGRPVAPNNSDTMVMPTEFSITNQPLRPMNQYSETCCAIMSKSSKIIQFILKLTKLCSDAGLANIVEKGQYITTLDDAELDKLKDSCREYTPLRSDVK